MPFSGVKSEKRHNVNIAVRQSKIRKKYNF